MECLLHPVATLAPTKVTQGTKEINFTQVGAKGLDKIELAVGALPQHEVAQSLLTRGADNQVRVGLPHGVKVFGNLRDTNRIGEVLQCAPASLVLTHHPAYCVRYFGPAPVTHRKIDVQA